MLTNSDKKLKELREELNKRKLDTIQDLAENESINHPQVLVSMVWELRSVVKTLSWLDGKEDKKNKYRNYAG